MPSGSPDMGRVKKISGLPAEIKRACRMALSRIGPRTKARIMGPGSRLTFRSRYPMTPKIPMT